MHKRARGSKRVELDGRLQQVYFVEDGPITNFSNKFSQKRGCQRNFYPIIHLCKIGALLPTAPIMEQKKQNARTIGVLQETGYII